MRTTKNQVPKSGTRKLSDLTPKKDTRGGKISPQGGPVYGNVSGNAGPGQADYQPAVGTAPIAHPRKKSVTL